jgi:hypothetical protein
MQKVSCPSCGAEVTFRSTASVMAVCDYCHSTLLKDAESVKDIGKMSDVLEDYSPVQINTSGVYLDKPFTVVGRIQLRYEAGFWNEWYVLFDDGGSGWLSDASGQYVMTLPEESATAAPEFESIAPGSRYTSQGATFFAADVRTAQCIAGQGELPFKVGKGWQAKVADFRADNRFLTIDYSEEGEPRLYLGQAVYLHEMRCQLLRSDDEIASTAGRFKGKTTALDCPSCGGGIQYQAGMAFHVVCPSCHAEVDCSTDKALVLQKHDELGQVQTTLSLGDVGNIDQIKYNVIGLMKCREINSDEFSEWVEYLLFNANKGYLWLVESDGEWDRVQVLNEWPESAMSDAPLFRSRTYKKLYEYGSEVIYAVGAFNWRICVGDKTRIIDFGSEGEKLTAEISEKEIGWSLSRRIPPSTVGQWFGKQLAETSSGFAPTGDKAFSAKAAKIYSILFGVLNVPIAFASGMDGFMVLLVGLALLWIPVFFHEQIAEAE